MRQYIWFSFTFGMCLVATAAADTTEQEYCYASDPKPYLQFASKTSYKLMFNNPPPLAEDESCTPAMIWQVMRHGTRYPMFVEHAVLKRLMKIRDKILRNDKDFHNVGLCAQDLQNLKDWKFELQLNESNMLTSQGYEDMFSLAERLKSRFPDFFLGGFSSQRFLVQQTNSKRTEQSAITFLKGLFGQDEQFPPTAANDYLLRGYMNCTTWKLDYATSEEIKKHKTNFATSKWMTKVISEVTRKLGFFFDLEIYHINAMYLMCSYDKAFKPNEVSPWCAVFTEEQLKILEYQEDMYYYYRHGYGMPINLKIACPLVRDLITRINETVENESNTTTQAVFYITHNGMFQRLLARLGIAHDPSPLTAEYDEDETRHWRLSHTDPFGANLAVVLYKCNESTNKTHRVKFFLNERYLPYEGCDNSSCSWTFIRDKFADIIDPSVCNLDDCNIDSSASATRNLNLFVLILLVSSVLLQ